jgi:hypothetical protein
MAVIREGGSLAGREELALIAELGVGFVGFVSVFLIFARRDGGFSPADGFRVRAIVLSALESVFFALLPLILHLYGLAGTNLWRSVSALGLLAVIATASHLGAKQRALSLEDRVELVGIAAPWILAVITGLLYLSNIAAPFHEPTAAPYVAAMVMCLAIAASNFVTIAFQRLL